MAAGAPAFVAGLAVPLSDVSTVAVCGMGVALFAFGLAEGLLNDGVVEILGAVRIPIRRSDAVRELEQRLGDLLQSADVEVDTDEFKAVVDVAVERLGDRAEAGVADVGAAIDGLLDDVVSEVAAELELD